MATPLTHIILTESIYESLFSDKERANFLIGTLLPDIRYLDKKIPRDKYHTPDMTLHIVLSQQTAFEQGIYFHSLLDQVRDEFYIKKGIYIPGGDEDFIVALKLLEDELLYNKIDHWGSIITKIKQFDFTIIPGVDISILTQRYKLLTDLMIQKPDNISRTIFMKGIGMTPEYIQKINTIIGKLKKDKQYYDLIEELYQSFYSYCK